MWSYFGKGINLDARGETAFQQQTYLCMLGQVGRVCLGEGVILCITSTVSRVTCVFWCSCVIVGVLVCWAVLRIFAFGNYWQRHLPPCLSHHACLTSRVSHITRVSHHVSLKCVSHQAIQRKTNIESWRSGNMWAVLLWQLNEICERTQTMSLRSALCLFAF